MADWADLHKGTVLGHPEDYPVLATYTLQLIGPQTFSFKDAAALKMRMDEIAREAQENMTDLLPPAYHVEIKEWDE